MRHKARLSLVTGGLLLLLLILQLQIWLGSSSVYSIVKLHHKIAVETQQVQQMQARNQSLSNEVHQLKSGKAAIEARARSELGMVQKGELFYQIKPKTAGETNEHSDHQ